VKKKSTDKELLFLPLGGAGEIGMNLNLYGYGIAGSESWIMIDLGITFSDDSLPGIDVILPDPAFIEGRRNNLLGLVLTHAHEDHIGAVQYLWRRLGCPIYATPFTLSVLRRKLAETGILGEIDIHEIPLAGRFVVGPFAMELITLTHSIPEPNAIAITTPVGTVMHTGDWKFDPSPVIGPTADEEALKAYGDKGILAIVCDSTNVFTPGESGSEADILENLVSIIGNCKGKVAVACFASNVARLETISKAAVVNDRDVVLAGRSLQRITQAAKENGYLTKTPAFIDEREAGFLPDDRCLIICTGSQGEPRAALSRIASGNHRNISLGMGDTVIFSSRVIPGNGPAISIMQDKLVRQGVDIITAKDSMIHVSGHPARDELARMYQHIRPKISVPVHGELRHLKAHAELALEYQVADAFVIENGTCLKLGPGKPTVVDQVESGRLAVDGNQLIHIDSEIVRSRIQTIWHGFAVITIVVDEQGLVDEPQISTSGLFDNDKDPKLDNVRLAIRKTLDELAKSDFNDDAIVAEEIRISARRALRVALNKRPVTRIHLVRFHKENK